MRRGLLARSLMVAASLVLASGCLGTKTLEEVDPEAAPLEPTYEVDVAPLMFDYCDSCHAPDGQRGTLGGVATNSCEGIRDDLALIEEMVFDREVMPPGGSERMTSEDLLTFRRWLDQGADCGP